MKEFSDGLLDVALFKSYMRVDDGPEIELSRTSYGDPNYLVTSVTELADHSVLITWLSGGLNAKGSFGYTGNLVGGHYALRLNADFTGAYITGTPEADLLAGTNGDDHIYGLATDDILTGYQGADFIDGGAGSDTVDYSRSIAAVTVDLASAGPQSGGHAQGDVLVAVENIVGSAYNDTLSGDAGDNLIDGGYGADIISGGMGHDRLTGGKGADTLTLGQFGAAHGGDGNDVITGGSGAGNQLFGDNDDDSLTAGDGGGNALHGGAGNDFLVAGAGGDLVYGDGGTDELRGGAGHDVIYGGAGDDILYGAFAVVATAPDELFGDAGEDRLYAGGVHGSVLHGGGDRDRLRAGQNGDTLYGDDGNDDLLGGAGVDFLYGGDGDDDIAASFLAAPGEAGDFISGGAGVDHLYGSGGNDYILGDDGYVQDADVMFGYGGDDTLFSYGGADQLDGGEGNDTAVLDRFIATANLTLVMTDVAATTTLEGDGTTIVAVETVWFVGGSGNDTVKTLDGDDNLGGGDGNDTLWGGGGDDTLTGGAGDDELSGGTGTNTLIGGEGNDTFIIDGKPVVVGALPIARGALAVSAHTALDDIADYTESDTIDLTHLSFATPDGHATADLVRAVADPDGVHTHLQANLSGGNPSRDASWTTIVDLANVTVGQSLNLRLDPAQPADAPLVLSVTPPVDAVPCFLAGTRIATPCGERAVETLGIGDRVRTVDGRFAAVKWIGRRDYNGPFAAANPALQPVRIASGALGGGLPLRDLCVSSQHAVVLHTDAGETVLIPAACLINGGSIRRDTDMAKIAFLHIELDAHDLVLAEGAATETFVDTGSRMMFQNAAEFFHLYPDHLPKPARDEMRRLEDGVELEAIRARLMDDASEPAEPHGALQGHVEHLTAAGTGWRLEGWVLNQAAPGRPVALEVLLDGVPFARPLANRYRADLEAAGLAGGRCAFICTLPRRGRIVVRRRADGAELASALTVDWPHAA